MTAHVNNGNDGPLRRLQRKLQAGRADDEDSRAELRPEQYTVPEEWRLERELNGDNSGHGQEAAEAGPQLSRAPSKKTMSLTSKIFIGSIAFFVVSLAIFGFVLLWGTNTISARNVEIAVEAPQQIKAGEPVSLRVRITNKNDTALENAVLLLEFPDGTRNADDPERVLDRVRSTLGEVRSGDTASEQFSAVFYGQENDTRDIAIRLEYRAEDSNATFVAEESYSMTISAAPIRLDVSATGETNSGREFPLEIAIVSTADAPLSGLLVEVAYPFGFTVQSSSREPVSQDTIWRIRELAPGEEWRMTVRGVLEGQNRDEKTFRLTAGLPRQDNANRIGISYGTSRATVRIVRPFLGVQTTVNGSSEERVSVQSGARVDGEIIWQNNTPARLSDVRIEAHLSGNALDKASVSSQSGFWQSAENRIIWDKNTTSGLAEIDPGESGRFRFSFTPRVESGNTALYNASGIALKITGSGSQIGATGEQRIEHSITRAVTVATRVSPAQRVLYHSGAFENSGLLPPQAEQETTYTVVWTLANSLNEVADGVLEAVLPPYVRWTGAVSPGTAAVSYDADARTVRWNAGALTAGTGFTRSPREVSFQIGFTPSIAQVGTSPVLVQSVSFTGQDTYTGVDINATAGDIDTRLLSESGASPSDAIVVE